MALLKYFKHKGHINCKEFLLPNPEGPLSSEIASDTIREANKEVAKLVLVEKEP